MVRSILDTNSHLPLEQQQALYEVFRLCCVCFHFLVYYGFSGRKDTHYFLNVKAFPLKTTKKAAFFPHFHEKHKAPKVAERRQTSPLKGAGGFGKGEVRKDENPCTPATRTVKTENSGKKEKTWENLRNMEKVVYLCSANPKIGYPGKFPARGKPSPTLPNV